LRSAWLAQELLTTFHAELGEVALIPSLQSGMFRIQVNDRVVWSRQTDGGFPAAAFGGRAAGSIGDAGAFSFYPTKVITSAEGGVIVTDDEGLYKEALIYRDQGKEGFTTNFHVRLGYNWRLSEPNAIIGLSQLRRLGQFAEHRRSVAGVYDEMLGRLGERAMPVRQAPGVVSNYYKYMVMLGDADRPSLKKMLREEYDVGLSGEVYDTPLHKQPVFAPWVNGDSLAMAEDIGKPTLLASRHRPPDRRGRPPVGRIVPGVLILLPLRPAASAAATVHGVLRHLQQARHLGCRLLPHPSKP